MVGQQRWYQGHFSAICFTLASMYFIVIAPVSAATSLVLPAQQTFSSGNPHQVMLAQSDLDYLPTNVTYNPAIPTPASVLGYPVGTWHVRHDQLVTYMKALAAASDRVTLEVTGHTHEDRELLLLTISSSTNQQNIATIKADHQATIQTGKTPNASAPLVMYMGYSVHGNEPSGSNASLLIAYYLAAGQGAAVDDLLNNAVVLLDPSLNPDGLSRFAQWANMHKGKHPSAQGEHREHSERFPSGRTNHYWFDLNRDWVLLTHPESRARIKQFHAWRPHVLTDFHEMGTDSTYFFQPGVPSRKNPLTGDMNVDLTGLLGEYHAQALDSQQQMYYTQENFDDFYYGKGSTYPDAHGSVGILFEQASSRGHLQHSINGPLSFAQSIQNQVTTSFSTFKGAVANKSKFLDHHAAFVSETKALQDDDKVGGYLVKLSHDTHKNAQFMANLQAHNIITRLLDDNVTIDNQQYDRGAAIFIPTNQPQYRLLTSLFSTRQNFPDNTFYDVSNWNIAFAYNLSYDTVNKREAKRINGQSQATNQLAQQDVIKHNNSLPTQHVGYVFTWQDTHAPALLYRLLAHDIQARIAAKPFAATTTSGKVKQFAAGSIVIPKGLRHGSDWAQKLTVIANEYEIKLHALTSGLTPQGIDLGSPSMAVAQLPNVMIMGGLGVSQYEVGEIWHYFDTRMNMPVAIVDQDRFSRVKLDEFTHIVFASGRYNQLSDKNLSRIRAWVKAGGVVIGSKRGTRFLANNEFLEADVLATNAIDNEFETQGLHFADQGQLHAKKLVAGAAYQVQVDPTHPLLFGVLDAKTASASSALLPMFKTNNMVLNAHSKPFIEVGKYTQSPLLGGYTAPELQTLIAGSSAIVAHPYGKGTVIGLTDNVNFRGYWRGTEKLMANAVFMAPLITLR